MVILTRLGVDRSEQGRGLGKALLKDALLRIASAADQVAARAVLIHCEDENAKAFYLSQAEFQESPTDPLHLFLLVSDIRMAVGASIDGATWSSIEGPSVTQGQLR